MKKLFFVACLAAAAAFADETNAVARPVKTYVSYTNRVHGLPSVRIGEVRWADGSVTTNQVANPMVYTSRSGDYQSFKAGTITFSGGALTLTAQGSGNKLALVDIATGATAYLCISNGTVVVK